ncbi:hypothetical protein KIH23_10265 [Flavobacterium sp. CYK-55]|uniref:hypothetical protein n=1 Tax=Flavobacterium sp. CYK-55 TaxID=2835529 RepID=UPI001BCDD561|nr:hypothetical protein [Flavobacterium sp. CYK-55]MBS7787682.1 hypothetical protein [Flavobacterium sp. CYK-55]
MEIKTFWNIILKGIGLWLLINSLYIFPQVAITIWTSQFMQGWNSSIPELVFGVIALIVYFTIACLFLFKTTFLITKLGLEKHFTETRIDISVSTNTVLKIIVILIGGITLINSFPNFIKELFEFFQQKEILRNYPNIPWMIFQFINSLIGYILITNSTAIVKLINKQTDK